MIRPLRRRHLWLVGATAAVAGPLYLAALAARPAPPVEKALPPALAEPAAAAPGTPAAPAGGGGAVELPTTPPILLRPAGGGALEAAADGFVEGADLLLYWAPDNGAPAGGEPTAAGGHLLGALRGGERQLFELPAAAAATPGVVILYSLGHGEEVARAPWPAAEGAS